MEDQVNNNKGRAFNSSKYSTIFMVMAFLLMVTPFISTFNEFLTSIFLKWELYKVLEDFVVPYQARILDGIFNFLRISSRAADDGLWVGGYFLELQWNCLGWQSGVLLIASFLTGFQGKFSKISRFETILIGVLGTYLINVLRLVVVGLFIAFVGETAAIVFHDWFSLILVIIWFFVFWWFSYSFVLEEKLEEKKLDTNLAFEQ